MFKKSFVIFSLWVSLCFFYGSVHASDDFESISLRTYNARGHIVQNASWFRPEIKGFNEADFDNIFPTNNPVSSIVGQISVEHNGSMGYGNGTGAVLRQMPDGSFEGITAKHVFYKIGCFWDTRRVDHASITLGQRVNAEYLEDHGRININAIIPDPDRGCISF